MLIRRGGCLVCMIWRITRSVCSGGIFSSTSLSFGCGITDLSMSLLTYHQCWTVRVANSLNITLNMAILSLRARTTKTGEKSTSTTQFTQPANLSSAGLTTPQQNTSLLFTLWVSWSCWSMSMRILTLSIGRVGSLSML